MKNIITRNKENFIKTGDKIRMPFFCIFVPMKMDDGTLIEKNRQGCKLRIKSNTKMQIFKDSEII
jgi:hypothetical protein